MARSGRWGPPLLVILTVVMFLVAGSPPGLPRGVATAGTSVFSAPRPSVPPVGQAAKVQHVIIVMMENHAFDSYFGVYCPRVSAQCTKAVNGIPPDTCVPYYPSDVSLGCVVPFNFTASNLTAPDLPHTWISSHNAYDGGAMDGFYSAEGKTIETFGHYNGSTIPVYWDIAQEFGLGTDTFSSALTYSLPNHWFEVAGAPPTVLTGATLGASEIPEDHQYLNESNVTSTIEQELANHTGVSWKYYDFPLSSYGAAINNFGIGQAGSAYALWSPLASKNQSYSMTSHFAAQSQFFSDVANGSLPNISYLIPNRTYSDHPPENITAGEDWIASIVNTVEASRYWNSTAIFVTWDEYGGFYDQVAPVQIDGWGDGFRVPLLVISPWTPRGLVYSGELDFSSILHFVEWRWGLGCLSTEDCNATLPLGFFKFSIDRSPIYFEDANDSVYPYEPAPAGTPPYVESMALLSRSEPLNGAIDWS